MSALDSIGEAQHRLLNADAEIGTLQVTSATPSVTEALIRARDEITEARATLGAVQLILRGLALGELLAHHEATAANLRHAVKVGRMPKDCVLAAWAEKHEVRAKALRSLIGPANAPVTATTEGGSDGR